MSPPDPPSGDAERRRRFEAVAADVYEPLQRFLRRRTGPHDAEELLDDVLLTIWRRLDDVPPDAVLAWSYGVARRCLANRRRGARRQVALVDRLRATYRPPPADDLTDGADYPELAAALSAMSTTDRELLTLWAWEELEPREIAAVLGTTANAVSLRLARAKKKLAAHIARQDRRYAGHKGPERAEEQP